MAWRNLSDLADDVLVWPANFKLGKEYWVKQLPTSERNSSVKLAQWVVKKGQASTALVYSSHSSR